MHWNCTHQSLKQVSNNANVEFYNSAQQGVRDYHNTILAGVEINKCRFVPPPKVLLNVNNITTVQSAILETYKNGDHWNNSYRILKYYEGKYFSIMLDDIQKTRCMVDLLIQINLWNMLLIASTKSDQFKIMLLKKLPSNLKIFRKERVSLLNLVYCPTTFF